MRDPKRIPKILEAIGMIWVKHPDMRLGQIIVNATNITGNMFFVEDDRMLEALKKFYKEY